jgi:hypothetical protein
MISLQQSGESSHQFVGTKNSCTSMSLAVVRRKSGDEYLIFSMSTKLSKAARIWSFVGLNDGFSNLGFILRNSRLHNKMITELFSSKETIQCTIGRVFVLCSCGKLKEYHTLIWRVKKDPELTKANSLHSFPLVEAQHPNCLFHR